MAGHVRRRPSGSWQAIASFRDETGKLVQLTKTYPSKTDANKGLPELLTQAQKRSRPAAPMTVDELLDLWWEVHSPKLAPSTKKTDRLIMNKHIRPALGALKLRVLTGYHIDRFYNQLAEQGLGAHAIRHVHNILRRALGQGVKWKWLPDNPAADASPPAAPRQKGLMPTPTEFEKLIQAADEESEWFGVYLRLTTIMAGRRGEITALRWGDFDETSMTVRVDEALSIGDNGVVVKGPKEDASERVLNIGPGMTARLAHFKTTVIYDRDDDPMFTLDPAGKHPINPATASRTFKRVRDKAGMPDIRLHDMRKVASSWMVGENISTPTVSYRLGHSRNSTTTTLDIYTRRMPEEDSEAGELLDRLVNGEADQ